MLRCSTPANPRTWSVRCWMLSMLRCSTPAKPRTWSARRLSCRQVIQYFSLSEFLLTHSGFSALLFMGRSPECCLCVLQFSCWDYVPGYRRLYLLSCMFTCTSCWISVITRARISRIHRLAGCPYIDLWIRFGISCAIRFPHFDTSVGAPIVGGYLLRYLVDLKNSLPAWGSLFDLCVSWGRDLSCFTFRDVNFEMSRRGVTEW